MNDVLQKLPVQFGQFFLYDRIGLGGMAEIFLAKRFAGLGAELQAAIKRILPSFITDDSFGDMLISEAKLCARLSHANIVYTYDLGKVDGLYYIAMEYVEGLDLNRLLGLLARSRRPLPLQFALYIIIEALKGLDYAHRLADEDGEPLGIIHRDISPTNILISSEGEIKVCDFGIAKIALIHEGSANIDEFHLKGKIAYMSPEHLNNEQLDHRADIYASGILLWELLSGRRMFKTKNEDETLRRAKAAEIPPLQDRGFPEFEMLNEMVMKALSKDPDDRFQSGREFIDALDDYIHAAGFMVSQLKFSDFLMEHFGESLLAQRRERERSLEELRDYRKRLADEEPRLSAVSAPRMTAPDPDALLASFADDDDDDEPEEHEQEPEIPQDIEVDLDEFSAKKDAKDSQDTEDPKEEPTPSFESQTIPSEQKTTPDRPSIPLEEVWKPDLNAKSVKSSAWVAAGMAAALAAAATVFYFYF